MTYPELMHGVSRGFELFGAVTLLAGFLHALAKGYQAARLRSTEGAVYRVLRTRFSRTILLVLEILVAADLIQTVTIEPTLHNVLVLAAIVLIRTFLSFSIDVEVEGELPWRKEARPGDGRLATEGQGPAPPLA